MTPIPADLVSPTAGPIIARGLPVVPPDGFSDTDIVTHHPNGTHCMTVFRDGPVDIASLLLDPARPEVRDHCARWLARHHGLTVGATAPDWTRYGGDDGAAWRLCKPEGGVVWFTSHEWSWTRAYGDCATIVVIPGISALTDPTESLALACLAAGGRS